MSGRHASRGKATSREMPSPRESKATLARQVEMPHRSHEGNSLKDRRAREEADRVAREAAERKDFEEKARKLAEEKVKKAEQAKKQAVEARHEENSQLSYFMAGIKEEDRARVKIEEPSEPSEIGPQAQTAKATGIGA